MQIDANPSDAVPWFKYFSPEGESEQLQLDALPLTVGRSENCGLRLNSQRISREHAVVYHEGSAYLVKDLQSTNGTFVNGKRIEQARLNHGDQIVFADVEVEFCQSGHDLASRVATQIMSEPDDRSDEENQEICQSVIVSVRRTLEAVTQLAVRIEVEPVVDLAAGKVIGYDSRELKTGAVQSPLPDDCYPAARQRRLQRLFVAEEVAGRAGASFLMLNLEKSELLTPWLFDSLACVQRLFRNNQQVVVVLPDNADYDTPAIKEVVNQMRENGLRIGYRGLAGGPQIHRFQELQPEYIKLALPKIAGAAEDENCVVELQAAVRAIHDMQCQVIATGVESEEQAALCRELGCGLVLYSSFERVTGKAATCAVLQ